MLGYCSDHGEDQNLICEACAQAEVNKRNERIVELERLKESEGDDADYWIGKAKRLEAELVVERQRVRRYMKIVAGTPDHLSASTSEGVDNES